MLIALAGICVWLWQVIGEDLGRGNHINAKHEENAAAAKGNLLAAHLTPTPGGPGVIAPPGRRPGAPRQDPVARAILSGARDQLARKVAAVAVAVDDPHAARGSPFDLVDRGLSDLLPLRTALLRHRMREPRLYGLPNRQVPGADDRRRALTGANLAVFLQTFASRVADGEALEPGDIVFVARAHQPARMMPTVVSDAVDEAGGVLVVTLDPADRVAREQPLSGLGLGPRYRLHSADLARIRNVLDLGDLRPLGQVRAL